MRRGLHWRWHPHVRRPVGPALTSLHEQDFGQAARRLDRLGRCPWSLQNESENESYRTKNQEPVCREGPVDNGPFGRIFAHPLSSMQPICPRDHRRSGSLRVNRGCDAHIRYPQPVHERWEAASACGERWASSVPTERPPKKHVLDPPPQRVPRDLASKSVTRLGGGLAEHAHEPIHFLVVQ